MRLGICNYPSASFLRCRVCYFLATSESLLLRSSTITAHELINTSSGVDELALTSIERVRGAGDFYFYHRVSFAFEFYCVVGLCCRLREEHIAVGHVLKHDGAIVFGMNTFFHFEFNINNVNCSIFHFGLQRYYFFMEHGTLDMELFKLLMIFNGKG